MSVLATKIFSRYKTTTGFRVIKREVLHRTWGMYRIVKSQESSAVVKQIFGESRVDQYSKILN